MSKIYKTAQGKIDIMNLYDEKLKSLNLDYEEIDVSTQYGRTRVVKAGNEKGKKIVLFHGFNAGAPITLEAVKDLTSKHCFYVVETLGQTTKSEEFIMNIKDDSFAMWADEVLRFLEIENGNIVGISYGAFIVQKLITYKPERVSKCVLVVPSGLVSGNFWEMTKKLTIPFIKWRITKKDAHLSAFIGSFIPKGDKFIHRMLSTMMKETNLDTRIPKLLKPKDVEHFDKPVFVMGAENDIYFPGDKVIKRSSKLFSNLKETYLLKNSNHMPSKQHYQDIQKKLSEWI